MKGKYIWKFNIHEILKQDPFGEKWDNLNVLEAFRQIKMGGAEGMSFILAQVGSFHLAKKVDNNLNYSIQCKA